MNALRKARTLWRLGPLNLARVAAYRAMLKSGQYKRRLPIRHRPAGPAFDWAAARPDPFAPAGADRGAWMALADRILSGQLRAFSNHWVHTGFPPRWHRSVITQVEAQQPLTHWTELPDFSLTGGDIKGYWEPARFDGLLILVQAWICTRQARFATAVEAWLADWSANNPANAGLQWKCGQETGIRLMHTVLAAELLHRWAGVVPTSNLAALVDDHATRIEATLQYAIGQDNNHGTSEAAALFSAGLFLLRHGGPSVRARAARWRDQGHHWLENRLRRLVSPDGSFSQHSVNYHRVMLDTCSFAETMRRWHDAPAFNALVVQRCQAATAWLAALTEPANGDAPNLGANDGARLFVLHQQPYRDFRPSVQWASACFLNQTAYANGPRDEQLSWLGLDTAHLAPADTVQALRLREAHLWADGGYAKLVAPQAWALLRLPRYRFRPSQSDALHLDLWCDGRCILGDAGSYSYNAEAPWMHYFNGAGAHNTVQFDQRDQMPRLSRFLFADWLDTLDLDFDASASTVTAGYKDGRGARHHRTVTLSAGRCTVVDVVSGMQQAAVLRWRLTSAAQRWTCGESVWQDGRTRISVMASVPLARFECVDGWQSLHYMEKSSLPVLEVEVHAAAKITTEITWSA